MKKHITSILVLFTLAAFTKTAMAGPTYTALPEVWSVNFSAKSPAFQGPGVVWGPNSPATNYWNYYYDATPGTPVSAGGQAYDTRFPLDPAYSGEINYEAASQANITKGTLGVPGYITSTYNRTSGIPITTIFDVSSVPGFENASSAWVYIYTLHGQQTPNFVGTTSFYSIVHGATVMTTLAYETSATWSDGHGNNYDVTVYDTTTNHPGIVAFQSFSPGEVSAMQIASIPTPEPGTAVLLGIGTLAGGIMKRKKYSSETV